jgi:hypothetical protein
MAGLPFCGELQTPCCAMVTPTTTAHFLASGLWPSLDGLPATERPEKAQASYPSGSAANPFGCGRNVPPSAPRGGSLRRGRGQPSTGVASARGRDC